MLIINYCPVNSKFLLEEENGKLSSPWRATRLLRKNKTNTYHFAYGDGEKLYGMLIVSNDNMGVHKFENDELWPTELVIETLSEDLIKPHPKAIKLSNRVLLDGPGTYKLHLVALIFMTIIFISLTISWCRIDGSSSE